MTSCNLTSVCSNSSTTLKCCRTITTHRISTEAQVYNKDTGATINSGLCMRNLQTQGRRTLSVATENGGSFVVDQWLHPLLMKSTTGSFNLRIYSQTPGAG